MPIGTVRTGSNYRHYKNGFLYTVLAISLDHETDKPVVVYFRTGEPNRSWTRSLKEFSAKFSEE